MKYTIQDGKFHKYEKENSKLRLKGGSWTINLDVLKKETETIKEFVYTTEKKEYRIDFLTAMTKGFPLMLGGEKKMVVPIKLWKQN